MEKEEDDVSKELYSILYFQLFFRFGGYYNLVLLLLHLQLVECGYVEINSRLGFWR